MTTKTEKTAPKLGAFGRYLPLWVGACIALGIAGGYAFPRFFAALAALEIAHVNLVVAVCVWFMIVPMLAKIDFSALRGVGAHWRGALLTLFVNWGVKPFSMAVFAWLFIGHLFAPWLPAGEIPSYIAGLILLAAAPCTAMVFVWCHLCEGDGAFTLTQVALNDIIMLFAFAPIVGVLLGMNSITVPWDTLAVSVGIYILAPVVFARIVRAGAYARGGDDALNKTLTFLDPLAMGALLGTLVLLFAFQGEHIIAHPLIIALLAVPILIQVYANAALAYFLGRTLSVAHEVSGPAALIGASNFFELAVATAISLFGLNSGAALATVVGVLIEVPVMLSVVRAVKATKAWYLETAR